MPDHYESNAFDEQNTEDAAGKGTKKRKSPVDRLKDYVEDRVMGKLTRVKDQKRLEKLKKENKF